MGCFLVLILMTASGLSDDVFVQVWEFEESEEGWKALVDCEVSWENGQLLVSGTGGDPHLGAAAKAKAGWTKLTFRCRWKLRRTGVLDDSGIPANFRGHVRTFFYSLRRAGAHGLF